MSAPRFLTLLVAVACLLVINGPATAESFGKAIIGTSSQPRTAGPTLSPGGAINYYSADGWDVSGTNAGDFSIVSAETGIQPVLSLYNSAFAEVVFRPGGTGERIAQINMRWTTYRRTFQDGKPVFTPVKSGVSSASLTGTGVMHDPVPGKPAAEQPAFCLADDDNPKAVQGKVYSGTGNAQIVNRDPIRTRGYPLTLNIFTNTQSIDLSGPMGRATFTYLIRVRYMTYAVGATNVRRWLVIDGDGSVLDFGAASTPGAGGPGVYSKLSRQADGTFMLAEAGPPENVHKYGNYTYWFNTDGNLTKLKDPAGNIQTITYSYSKPIRVDDLSSKKYIAFVYSGSYIQKIVPNGAAYYTKLDYSYGKLTTVDVMNANGTLATRTKYAYSGDNLLSVTRDDDPNTTASFTYTTFPTMRSSAGIRKANVSTKLFTSKIDWSQISGTAGTARVLMADSKGAVTTLLISAAGDVLSVTPPAFGGSTESTTRTMTYDANHNVLSVKGPGISRTFTYTARGQLSRVTDGAGGFTAYEYNGANLKRVYDAIGTLFTLYYDDTRFPSIATRVVHGDGAVWTRALNAFGQPTVVTPPAGSATGPLTLTYDENPASPTYGWPLKAVKDGVTQLFAGYNAMGDLTKRTTSPNGVTNYTETLDLDGAQRPVKQTRPDGKSVAWTYKGRNVATYIDEAGIATAFEWCAPCGKLMGIVKALGWANRLMQDADRRTIGFVDSRGGKTVYTNGSNGELLQTTYPDGGKRFFKYHASGRAKEVKNSREQAITLAYDAAGRIASRKAPAFTENWAYFPDGRPKTVATAAYSTAFTYSAARRIETVKTSVKVGTTSVPQTLTAAYYPDGKLSTLTWTCGTKTACTWTYTYGTAGRLASVTNSFGAVTRYAYDRQGKLVSQSNSNNTSMQLGYYEPRGWVNKMTHLRGSSPFASYELAYDGGLNRVPLLTGVRELDKSVAAYQYDALRRLTRAARTGTTPYSHVYGYDLAGNREAINGTRVATFDLANKLSTSSFGAPTHDADGNLVMLGGSSGSKFTYDAENRMTGQAKGTVSISYLYDFAGRRILSQAAGDVPTVYVYAGDKLIGEVRNGVPSAVYTWGEDGLVSQTRLVNGGSPATTWFHHGPQGETRQLTDATGAVVATYTYTAYGVQAPSLSKVVNPFRYGGKYGYYTDGPNGLMLCGLRWYSPELGRWLSRDPIGYAGGENLYGYCQADPVNGYDPHGTDTYLQNRQILWFGQEPRWSWYLPSHTFVFTTRPDGSLAHTYSWGNTPNVRGWHMDQPEDVYAANRALETGRGLNRVGGPELDPFVQEAYDELNRPENEHDNGWVTNNCKEEAANLIDRAKERQRER